MNRLLCRGFSFLRTVASIHAATNPNGSKAAVSDAGPPVGRVFRAMRGPEADYASECNVTDGRVPGLAERPAEHHHHDHNMRLYKQQQ
jgi:hypothetical protein